MLRQEDKIVHDVLEAARVDLDRAAAIASRAQSLPIDRYLLAPLSLKQPSPETFRLALETAADKEFVQMHKGDKLLESVVGIAPLLGLLGTVTGLIITFNHLNIGGGGASEGATKAAGGIGEALITTAFRNGCGDFCVGVFPGFCHPPDSADQLFFRCWGRIRINLSTALV